MDAAIQRGICSLSDIAAPPDGERLFETVRGLIQAAMKAGKTVRHRLALRGERAGRLWAEDRTDAAIQIDFATL